MKYRKRPVVTVLILFMMGCGMYPGTVEKAEEFCEGHGGWGEILAPPYNTIVCVDGSQVDAFEYKLIERSP